MITNLAFSSQSGEGLTFFQKFVPALVGLTLIVGIVIFFFMLITGAIAWLSSSGDKGSIETARGKVSNAIIGIVILLSIYAVVSLAGNFFHINLTTININSLFTPAGGGPGGGGGTGTGGGGNGGGGGTGVAACGGCINGGCGILGRVYLGPEPLNQPYLCSATGWTVRTDLSVNETTCGTCN